MEKVFEYSYDAATLQISRDIIKVFKAALYHEEAPGQKFRVGDYELFGGVLPVVTSFVEGTKVITSAGIAIAKSTNTPFMYITIAYRPGKVQEDFNKIVSEVKGAVRHELEHIGQMQKQGKAKIDWRNPVSNPESPRNGPGVPDPKIVTKYYLLPHEVEAHVKGLLKMAKTKRVPLEQELIKFVDHLTDLNDSQKKKILTAYKKYAEQHNLFHVKPISKTYNQNNESKMNTPSVMSFKEFQRIDEKVDGPKAAGSGRGAMKALVGKGQGEELNVQDAQRIGQKISKMSGKARQKYIGIVNFMGASCKIFNAIWQNYKPVDKNRKAVNQEKEYNKPAATPAPAA